MSKFIARWIHWLLILITLAAWATVMTHDFSPVDDVLTISQNPKLNPPRFTSDSVLWFWTHAYMGLYVPVTYTAWGLLAKATWVSTPDEHGLFLDARVFHAASLLAHMISVLGVYGILRSLFSRSDDKPNGDPVWPAAFGALLFALHPLQVETVAWASGLKDVMSGAFSLTAIWLYLQAAEPRRSEDAKGNAKNIEMNFLRAFLRAFAPSRSLTSIAEGTSPASAAAHGRDAYATRLYLWSMAALLTAMLCKPSAMVTPLIGAILDYFIVRRDGQRVLRSIAPWLLIVIPLAIIAKAVQPGTGVASPPIYERPIIAGASLAFYLGKLLLPINLTFDYGWQPLVILHWKWIGGVALIPVAIGIGVWLSGKRWLCAAGAVSIAALLPVLGFVPFMYQSYSTVADHYIYLAMLGPAMAVAYGLSQVARRNWIAATVGCAVLLLLLAAVTFRQLTYWQDEETLLRRMIAIKPASLAGHNGLGKQYENRHDFVNAEREYQKTLAIDSTYLPARENLVKIWRTTGRAEDAIQQVYLLMNLTRRRTDTNPDAYKEAFYQLGQLTMTQGLYSDAARYFQEDLKLNPDHLEAQAALGRAAKMFAASTKPAEQPAPPGRR